jgi:hypothetical protein
VCYVYCFSRHPFLLYPHFIDHWTKRLNKDQDDILNDDDDDDDQLAAMFTDDEDNDDNDDELIETMNKKKTRKKPVKSKEVNRLEKLSDW